MTSNLENIYDECRAEFVDNPDWVIGFFSKYNLFLNNIKTFNDEEELRYYIKLTSPYLNAIYQKDRFNDTIDHADKCLLLIDSEISRLHADQLRDDWYNSILHLKGMAAYRLRDYKTATPIYKHLTNADPRNDSFKSWLNFSLYGQRLWLVHTINIICGLLLVIYFFSEEYIKIFSVRISILGVAMLGLFGNWGYEYYVKRSFRRVTQQKNNGGA